MEVLDRILEFASSENGLAVIGLLVSLFVGGSKARIFGGTRWKTIKRVAGRLEDDLG